MSMIYSLLIRIMISYLNWRNNLITPLIWQILVLCIIFWGLNYYYFVMDFSFLSINMWWICWHILRWLIASLVILLFILDWILSKLVKHPQSMLHFIDNWLEILSILLIVDLTFPFMLVWFLDSCSMPNKSTENKSKKLLVIWRVPPNMVSSVVEVHIR